MSLLNDDSRWKALEPDLPEEIPEFLLRSVPAAQQTRPSEAAGVRQRAAILGLSLGIAAVALRIIKKPQGLAYQASDHSNSERGTPPGWVAASARISSATSGTMCNSLGTSGAVKPCAAR